MRNLSLTVCVLLGLVIATIVAAQDDPKNPKRKPGVPTSPILRGVAALDGQSCNDWSFSLIPSSHDAADNEVIVMIGEGHDGRLGIFQAPIEAETPEKDRLIVLPKRDLAVLYDSLGRCQKK